MRYVKGHIAIKAELRSSIWVKREKEGGRRLVSMQGFCSLGNGGTMPWVSDYGRWHLLGERHWRLDTPLRHPVEMSSGQWGESGVQEKTWLKRVDCSSICKKKPWKRTRVSGRARRLGGYKSHLTTLNSDVQGLPPPSLLVLTLSSLLHYFPWMKHHSSMYSWHKPLPVAGPPGVTTLLSPGTLCVLPTCCHIWSFPVPFPPWLHQVHPQCGLTVAQPPWLGSMSGWTHGL